MKKLSLLILFIALGLNGQENNESIVSPKVLDEHAFKVGEYLKYTIDYGIISAGYAELAIEKKSKKEGIVAIGDYIFFLNLVQGLFF